jgi:carboxypeptidase C (cathepsin A)
VLYLDQPIGTGFSYGDDTVNSTFSAAPPIWQAIQLLFESPEFAGYSSREFILATESYGGHYGPEFAEYFEIQNNAIAAGKLAGVQIKLSGLMINKCGGILAPSFRHGANARTAVGSTPSSKTSSISPSRRTRRATVRSCVPRQSRR